MLAKVTHVDANCYDHTALLIGLEPSSHSKATLKWTQFRFEAAWLYDPECDKVIAASWHVGESE